MSRTVAFIKGTGIFLLFSSILLYRCSTQDQIISPVARLTVSPLTGDTNTAFYLDGELSQSRENVPFGLTYYWTLDDTIQLNADHTLRRTSFRIHATGSHTFKLTVKNSWNVEDSDSCTVLVQEYYKDSIFRDPRDGQEYKIVLYGDYWWFTENLRYGRTLAPGEFPSDNGIVEKFVLDPDSEDQDGYYTAQEVHLYSVEPDSTICPPGWSLPYQESVDFFWNSVDIFSSAARQELFTTGCFSDLALTGAGGYFNLDSLRFENHPASFWWGREFITIGKPEYDFLYTFGNGPMLASKMGYSAVIQQPWFPRSAMALPVRCIKQKLP